MSGTAHQFFRRCAGIDGGALARQRFSGSGDASLHQDCLDGEGWVPGKVAHECRLEVVQSDELLTRIGGLLHEKSKIDEREHDLADITCAHDSPTLEHDPAHQSVTVECELPAGIGELAGIDVPPRIELRL